MIAHRRDGVSSRHDTTPNSRKLTILEEEAILLSTRNSNDTLHVGKNWATNFVKRRPELKTRLSQKYDYQRAKCEDPKLIGGWFQLIQAMKARYGILDDDIYNFDETGFAMGIISTITVVTGAECRGRAKLAQPGNREWATVIQGVNAQGWAIPPFIILAGQYHLSSWWPITKDLTLEGRNPNVAGPLFGTRVGDIVKISRKVTAPDTNLGIILAKCLALIDYVTDYLAKLQKPLYHYYAITCDILERYFRIGGQIPDDDETQCPRPLGIIQRLYNPMGAAREISGPEIVTALLEKLERYCNAGFEVRRRGHNKNTSNEVGSIGSSANGPDDISVREYKSGPGLKRKKMMERQRYLKAGSRTLGSDVRAASKKTIAMNVDGHTRNGALDEHHTPRRTTRRTASLSQEYAEDTSKSFKSGPGPNECKRKVANSTPKSTMPKTTPHYAQEDDELSDIDEEPINFPKSKNRKHRDIKPDMDDRVRHIGRNGKNSRRGYQDDEEEDSDGGPDPPSTDPDYEESEEGIVYGVDLSDDDSETEENDEPIPRSVQAGRNFVRMWNSLRKVDFLSVPLIETHLETALRIYREHVAKFDLDRKVALNAAIAQLNIDGSIPDLATTEEHFPLEFRDLFPLVIPPSKAHPHTGDSLTNTIEIHSKSNTPDIKTDASPTAAVEPKTHAQPKSPKVPLTSPSTSKGKKRITSATAGPSVATEKIK
ncbi:hypothetical protein Dda_2171 [Drechslerella dactyloides]|uniref:HTH CENPB-type domain-containing protein n=1 Tax=Drechslerella dactyloides TaxID=74499 RepID=A0AAD6NNN1_DREDA|nr:hypothetical protein Dda_2171 [Drechslerella dactyloides]